MINHLIWYPVSVACQLNRVPTSNISLPHCTKMAKEDLVKTNASLWLQFEENTKGEVTRLTCSTCKFKKGIQYNRDFSDMWIKGCTNLRPEDIY